MHLPSTHAIILFAGLVYAQLPPVIQSIASDLSLASNQGNSVPAALVSSLTSLTAVPITVPTGVSTGSPSSESIKTTISETKSSEVITTTPSTQTSSIVFDTSSASSRMSTSINATGASKETTKTATMSTTVGTASGNAASGTGNSISTSTTSASASPTAPNKSNAAGQVSGFINGAGIVLLAAMLEDLERFL